MPVCLLCILGPSRRLQSGKEGNRGSYFSCGKQVVYGFMN